MSTDNESLEQALAKLGDVQDRLGSDHPDTAFVMLECAHQLRAANQLLRAANLEAQANVILDQHAPGESKAIARNVETAVAVASPEETLPGEKQCPFCAETIKSQAVLCKHCHMDLRTGSSALINPAQVAQVRSGPSRTAVWRSEDRLSNNINPAQVVLVQSGPSPGVAAVLSFFVPGAGHMYAGHVGTGLFILVGCIVTGLITFGIGSLVFWLIGIFGSMNACQNELPKYDPLAEPVLETSYGRIERLERCVEQARRSNFPSKEFGYLDQLIVCLEKEPDSPKLRASLARAKSLIPHIEKSTVIPPEKMTELRNNIASFEDAHGEFRSDELDHYSDSPTIKPKKTKPKKDEPNSIKLPFLPASRDDRILCIALACVALGIIGFVGFKIIPAVLLDKETVTTTTQSPSAGLSDQTGVSAASAVDSSSYTLCQQSCADMLDAIDKNDGPRAKQALEMALSYARDSHDADLQRKVERLRQDWNSQLR